MHMTLSLSNRLELPIAVFAALLLTGCGESPPATVEVTGQVLLDGEPCEAAMVMFQPASGRPATGRTDGDGRFTLTTFSDGDGAVPGEHVVVVTPFVNESLEMEEVLADNAGADDSYIPEHYQAAATSPLRATVGREGDNGFVFELAR